jgi:hypothetical protein
MMMTSFKGKHRVRSRAGCAAGPTARLRAQTAILYYRGRGREQFMTAASRQSTRRVQRFLRMISRRDWNRILTMRKLRILGIVSLGVILAISLRCAISFSRFHSVERKFEQLQKGQSGAFVIATLGRPNYHEGTCSLDLSPPPNCFKEYVYSHPFAPFVPEYYIVWFSSDNRVFSTEHEISP